MFSSKIGADLISNKHIFNLVKCIVCTKHLSSKVRTTLKPIAPVTFNKCIYSTASVSEKKNICADKFEKYAVSTSSQEEIMMEIVKRGKPLSNDEIEDFKTNIMVKGKTLNSDNIDAIFLSNCILEKAFEVGRSYFFYIYKMKNKYNIASVGKFFQLCFMCQNSCTNEDKMLIIDLYKELIAKYKVLDSITCENALLGLSITPEWKEGVSLLKMCKLTGEPTSKMFNALVMAAFKNGEDILGWKQVENIFQNNKVLSRDVSECILKKDKKNLNLLLELLEKYDVHISPELAELFIDNYKLLSSNGNAKITTISKKGQCSNCTRTLQTTHLSDKEFQELKKEFLNPVLIGKDVFLKTEPSELKSFLAYIKSIGEVDVVLDGLNIAYVVGKKRMNYNVASNTLYMVVNHFVQTGKRALIIGRKHMNKWPKKTMDIIKKKSFLFLTDNVSADDPFVLYAAINSGLGTIFISRDQMRSHTFLLKEPKLRASFIKWQQMHQYYLKYISSNGKVILENPLPYLQSGQHSEGGSWHLPLKCSSDVKAGVPAHLIPHITSWLCLP